MRGLEKDGEIMFYPLLVFTTMTAWAVLHSWLAALSTKVLARDIFGQGVDRFYRLGFVVIAILTLLPSLAMVVLLPSQVLWRIPSPWVYVTGAVQILAGLGLIIGVFHTDVMAFVGVRQLVQSDSEQKTKLITVGLYGLVRHPLYFFGLVLIWLTPYMTDLILAFNIAATLYLILGTIPEEKKMVAIYGPAYEEYQENVPRIIPGLKF